MGFPGILFHPDISGGFYGPLLILTQPMDPEKKSLNFIFPTKYSSSQKV